LPAESDDLALPYPVALVAHVTLPSELYPAARERLRLVVSGPGELHLENTFTALDQPAGMNISPAFEPPVQVPRVTPEALEKHVGSGDSVSTTFNGNLAMVGLPAGSAKYRARAVLDDLHSNELDIEVRVDAPR
jgi:hypothetical protein